MQREDTEGREHTEARLPPPLLRMATSPIPPSALYSSMAAAMTATMITIAPTTNQFLPIFRARVARYAFCCVLCAARCVAHLVSFSCWVS
jgi:hypothetical protein